MKEMVKNGGIILYGLVILLLISCSDKHEVVVKELEQFYKDYIHLYCTSNDCAENELLEYHTTKEVLEKISRGVACTDGDQILKAQDMVLSVKESVKARHLEDDWYMVSYSSGFSDTTWTTEIPLKAKQIDDKLQITYLPISINGSQFGDDLLVVPTRVSESDISMASAKEFLESFYDVYVSGYCMMISEQEIVANTKKLRDRYFSENALAQFKEADDSNLFDSREGFDLLVGNFDFDPMWYKSLEVKDVGDGCYQISYHMNGWREEIEVVVASSERGYIIDSIKSEPY